MPQTFEALYYQGLESLLQCTDEKKIYVAKFSDYINRYDATSLLDIGAGDGQVALPLSEMVEDYVAIEQNPQYAARLRQAGKQVIEEVFPTEVRGLYDLVLMSHVISHTAAEHTTLVPPAWELVKPSGHLLVVTHIGTKQDDWSQLLDHVGLGYSEKFNDSLHDCLRTLQVKGETEIQNVTSTLTADNVTQMIAAMAFLASNGERARHDAFMDRAAEVATILGDKYHAAAGLSFPFLHLFVSTQKPTTVVGSY
ncbi:MAG: methyltransferase domain-containing protein [bacterium]|nr:methyltransferase domain-containing protein [bacterium]